MLVTNKHVLLYEQQVYEAGTLWKQTMGKKQTGKQNKIKIRRINVSF